MEYKLRWKFFIAIIVIFLIIPFISWLVTASDSLRFYGLTVALPVTLVILAILIFLVYLLFSKSKTKHKK